MLRLSPRHGVNPMVTLCPLCRKPSGIALMGYIRDDAEAPFEGLVGGITDPPCADCAGLMKYGVILVSVRDGAKPPNPQLTGGFAVVTEAYVRRVFRPAEFVIHTLRKRYAVLEDAVWDELGFFRGPVAGAPAPPAEPGPVGSVT